MAIWSQNTRKPQTSPFWEGGWSKRKHFFPLRANPFSEAPSESKVFPFRADLFSEGVKINFDNYRPWKYQFHLRGGSCIKLVWLFNLVSSAVQTRYPEQRSGPENYTSVIFILCGVHHCSQGPFTLWASAWQIHQNGMCVQRRLRSARASARSDQSLRCALNR